MAKHLFGKIFEDLDTTSARARLTTHYNEKLILLQSLPSKTSQERLECRYLQGYVDGLERAIQEF